VKRHSEAVAHQPKTPTLETTPIKGLAPMIVVGSLMNILRDRLVTRLATTAPSSSAAAGT
jgi:hypothetical protein